MEQFNQYLSQSQASIVSTNKVLKNTYLLFSATLAVSAVFAAVSMAMGVPLWVSILMHIVSFIVSMVLGLFVLPKIANSAAGIGVIFLITTLIGFSLGALHLMLYSTLPPEASLVIATAFEFGGAAAIFLGLSGYALTSRRDFRFMGGFLFAGMMVVSVGVLPTLFFPIPGLSLALSTGIILLICGLILLNTSRMINGSETNYSSMETYGVYPVLMCGFIMIDPRHIIGSGLNIISITVTYAFYLSLFNILINHLHLMMAFAGSDDQQCDIS